MGYDPVLPAEQVLQDDCAGSKRSMSHPPECQEEPISSGSSHCINMTNGPQSCDKAEVSTWLCHFMTAC